jgi:VanZ family protein
MRRRLALVALPLYWVALFIATHYPRVRLPGEIPQGDKILHFSAFGLLAVLFWAFTRVRRKIGPHFVWGSAAGLVAYAGLDEWLQQFVGRYTDLNDFFANAAGITTVSIVLELLRRRSERKQHEQGTLA